MPFRVNMSHAIKAGIISIAATLAMPGLAQSPNITLTGTSEFSFTDNLLLFAVEDAGSLSQVRLTPALGIEYKRPKTEFGFFGSPIVILTSNQDLAINRVDYTSSLFVQRNWTKSQLSFTGDFNQVSFRQTSQDDTGLLSPGDFRRRFRGGINYTRQTSERHQLIASLNSARETTTATATQVNIFANSASLESRYRVSPRVTTVFSTAYSRLSPDGDFFPDNNGVAWRGGLVWTPRERLVISGQGGAFLTFISNDQILNFLAEGSVEYRGESYVVQLSGSRVSQPSVAGVLRQVTQASAFVRRRLGRRKRFELTASATYQEAEDLIVESAIPDVDQIIASGEFRWSPTKFFQLQAFYSYFRRDGLLFGTGDSNRVGMRVSFSYQP